MLIVTKGYLLSRHDDGDFNEVIAIINEHGLKFNCYCLGTKKITSKNARNLDFGNYIEFIFFYSDKKLSKLKKASAISYLDQQYKNSLSLLVLNDYFNQMEFEHKKYFQVYQQIITYLIRDLNDYLIILMICLKIMELNGISINLDKCSKCDLKLEACSLCLKDLEILCSFCKQQQKQYLSLNHREWIFFKKLISGELDPVNIDINEVSISTLRNFCLQLMFYINEELGLYSNFMTSI